MSRSADPCLLSIIRPITLISGIFGVCPLSPSSGGVSFSWSSIPVLRCFINLILVSLYLSHLSLQFYLSFSRGSEIQVKVDIALWIGGSLLSISMLLVKFLKRHKTLAFFGKISDYRSLGVVASKETLAYSRKLCTFYFLIFFISTLFVVRKIVREPRSEVSILAYYDGEPGWALVLSAALFQAYLMMMKNCSIAFIEILCSSLAASYCNIVHSIGLQIGRTTNTTSASNNLTRIHVENNLLVKNVNRKQKQQQQLYPVVPFTVENLSKSTPQYMHLQHKDQNCELEASAGEEAASLVAALKKYSCISKLQRMTNCIFGGLLLIDSSLLVFTTCLLLYLQIFHLKSSLLGDGGLEGVDVAIFSAMFTIAFIKLLILFLSLGRVHETSLWFNGLLSTGLMELKEPRGKDVSLVMAHLSVNAASPTAFSAMGFFTFTKGSLGTVLSGVITYAVFLLQAKNSN